MRTRTLAATTYPEDQGLFISIVACQHCSQVQNTALELLLREEGVLLGSSTQAMHDVSTIRNNVSQAVPVTAPVPSAVQGQVHGCASDGCRKRTYLNVVVIRQHSSRAGRLGPWLQTGRANGGWLCQGMTLVKRAWRQARNFCYNAHAGRSGGGKGHRGGKHSG